MHIKLQVKSIVNIEIKKRDPSYLYGIEVHVLSSWPTLIKKEH